MGWTDNGMESSDDALQGLGERCATNSNIKENRKTDF